MTFFISFTSKFSPNFLAIFSIVPVDTVTRLSTVTTLVVIFEKLDWILIKYSYLILFLYLSLSFVIFAYFVFLLYFIIFKLFFLCLSCSHYVPTQAIHSQNNSENEDYQPVIFDWTNFSVKPLRITSIAGVVFIIMGMIGEKYIRMYICRNKSPLYTIEDTINLKLEKIKA